MKSSKRDGTQNSVEKFWPQTFRNQKRSIVNTNLTYKATYKVVFSFLFHIAIGQLWLICLQEQFPS